MAFLRKPPAAAQPASPIPRLADDVEYARFAAVRRTLMDAVADRQRRLDIFTLRAELNQAAVYPQGNRRATARARLAQLEAASPPPKPETPEPGDLPPAIAAALRIAAGDELDLPQDVDAVRQRLRREVAIFEDGLRATEIALDEIKAARSVAASEQCLAAHRAVLRSIFDAAAGLAAAMDAERGIIAEIIATGHDPAFHILHRPTLTAGARIGSFAEFDSDISRFRRDLESQGVL